MNLMDLTSHAGEWLRGNGPMSEIVISSRIRLARNLAAHRFLSKCSRHQRQVVENKARETVLNSGLAPQMLYVDLDQAPEIDRQLLVAPRRRRTEHAAGGGRNRDRQDACLSGTCFGLG